MHDSSLPSAATVSLVRRDGRELPLLARIASFAIVALAVTMADRSAASTSMAMTIDDAARASTAIVRVTPLDRTAAWEDGRIVTTARLHVDRVVAGAVEGEEIRVRTLGGAVGSIGQAVEGEASFAGSAPSLVFVAREGDTYRVVGRAQGQLLVVANAQGRAVTRLRGLGILVAKPVRPPAANAPLVTTLEGLDATEATATIARAWEVTHAR